MKNYTMPVLTEQERENLIALARIEVKRWDIADGKQYMVELMNIALAALTAKPEYFYRIRSDGGREGPLHESETESVRKKSWEPLYTAPTVPVTQEGEQ